MIASDSEISARISSARVDAEPERLPRHLVGADDAARLLALLRSSKMLARTTRRSALVTSHMPLTLRLSRAIGPTCSCVPARVAEAEARALVPCGGVVARRDRRASAARRRGRRRRVAGVVAAQPSRRRARRTGGCAIARGTRRRRRARRRPRRSGRPASARPPPACRASTRNDALRRPIRLAVGRSAAPTGSGTRCTMFIAGPAEITTIRFHTGWR